MSLEKYERLEKIGEGKFLRPPPGLVLGRGPTPCRHLLRGMQWHQIGH